MPLPSVPVEDSVPISVPMRLHAVVPPGPGPHPVLLGLHGYAMRALPFLGLMRRFAPERFLLVSLQGPHSAFSPGAELSAKGERGYHWGVSETASENQATHRACLDAAIGWAARNGGDLARVSLAGFSQPCSFNYRVSLAPPHGKPFRALVALCGGLPGEWVGAGQAAPPPTSFSRETAVLHVSTESDPYYPPDRIAPFEGLLASRFRSARHLRYPGTHHAPSAAFEPVLTFLDAEG